MSSTRCVVGDAGTVKAHAGLMVMVPAEAMHGRLTRLAIASPTSVSQERKQAQPIAVRDAIEQLPHGILVVDGGGRVLYRNSQAARLIASSEHPLGELACCSLLGCRSGSGALADACLTEQAVSRGTALPEVRVEVSTSSGMQTLWVTAAPLADGRPGAVLQLRPSHARERGRRLRGEPSRRVGHRLRIATLGETTVESSVGVVCGDWLGRLPGQLLKYLVVMRNRIVTVDEIGEALWSEVDYSVAPKVRYYIHSLRRAIEPERVCREPSSLIVSRAGAYHLNLDRVRIDADEFQAQISSGLELAASGHEAAGDVLERALTLYRGEFLSDVPHAEWAMAERDRLRNLACAALQGLADLSQARGDIDGVVRHLSSLASLRPYDEDLHRNLMQIEVQRGRLTDALRRYDALDSRMRRVFGRGPRFAPADLTLGNRG